MQAVDISRVHDSWRQLTSLGSPAAALLCHNFFALQPQLRTQLRDGLVQHCRRLYELVEAVVITLDNQERLARILRFERRRHADLGLLASRYDSVAAALLKTLDQTLGDAFSAEVEGAWIEALGLVAETVTRVGGPPQSATSEPARLASVA